MDRREFIKSTFAFSSVLFLTDKNLFSLEFKLFDEIQLIEKKLDEYKNISSDLSISDIIIYIGEDFVGTPYEAGTLDVNTEKEELVLKISGFDCVTFVENILTFSRLTKLKKINLDNFKNELTRIRYRDGIITDYTSRLHYFSDWIFNNEKKEIVKNITADIGGNIYDKEICFMTKHKESYKQLENDKSLLYKMFDIEDNINARRMFYLKKSDVKKNQSEIKSGDIIALTTDIEGLDVTHTGFAYVKNDKLLFLHASQKSGKVIISNEGLLEYINSIKKCSGLMIARPY